MDKKLKQRVVKVNTAEGEKNLRFVVEERTVDGICCGFCSYNGICEKLPHPEQPDNESLSFIDFCNFCINDEEDEDKAWIPAPGTIEENLSGISDPYRKLATRKDNIYVPLKKVIDTACAGICADYTEDHSGCNCNNKFCLLKDLFTSKEEPVADPVVDEKEEEEGADEL